MIRSIGILGGTFDPVHNAHLDLARTALTHFGLDSVLFIPASLPPHKDKTFASYDQRVAMVDLAIRKQHNFLLSRVEEEISGPSYTVKTIQFLKKDILSGDEISLIVGLDTFNDIKSWYHYQELPTLVNFIVIGRKGHDEAMLFDLLEELGYKNEGHCGWTNKHQKRVDYISHNPPAIASSDIREKLAAKESIAGLLPESVAEYIVENALYCCNPSE